MTHVAPRVALFVPDDPVGDRVESFRRELSARLPGALVAGFSPATAHRVVERFPDRPDALVVSGGDLLRLDVPPSALSHDGPYPPFANLWLLPALLGRDWDVPVLWDAPGAPRPFDPDHLPLLRAGAAGADLLAVGDPLTRGDLLQAGVCRSVNVVPDADLVVDELYPEADLVRAGQELGIPAAGEGRTLCLHVEGDWLTERVGEVLGQLCRLIPRPFDRVLLAPGCDLAEAALAEVQAALGGRAVLLGRPRGALDRAAVVWSADALVGTSLPVCLAALAFGEPHLALAFDRRLRGYDDLTGRSGCVLQGWSELSAHAGLLGPAEAASVAAACRRLREHRARHLDLLADHIRRACQSRRPAGPPPCWTAEGLESTAGRLILDRLAALGRQARHQAVLELSRDAGRWRAGCLEARARARELTGRQIEFRGKARVRLAEGAYRRLRAVPGLVPALVGLVRLWRRVAWSRRRLGDLVRAAWLTLAEPVGRHLGIGSARLRRTQPLLEASLEHLRAAFRGPPRPGLRGWFDGYRPTARQKARWARRTWPNTAPSFTVVVLAGDLPEPWLRDSLDSVAGQTYPPCELIVVGPAGAPPTLAEAVRTARGSHVCLLDHGDMLEPQALYRFAEAILKDDADLLYGDVVVVGDDPDEPLAVQALPQFSYDLYLAHTYFRHATAVRTSLLRQAAPGETAEGGWEVDTLLRVLERAERVDHIPDLLYRRRPRIRAGLPEKHDAERKAVAAHLRRLGWNAVVEPAVHPACRDVRFPWHGDGRVAIVIPTRNRHDLLARCVASIEATVPPGLASLCVMDHESDDPATLAFLDGLAGRHAVLPYRGRFNFAAMMNAAAARLGRDFPLLLFLNNDTEATAPGWLEHMVGLARRPDVGVVGAVLWYPDRRVQHAGVWVGMHRAADHPWRGLPALEPDGRRSAGPGMSLLATRDQSAVTGACLLIRSEVFAAAGGFDEELRIGFNDTDLCLKVRRLGYRVLLDGQAVLLHHESATRGKEGLDPHPDDTHRFQERYAELIEAGDPYYSSLLSCHDETRLAADACSALSGPARTVAVVLPRPPAPPVRRAA